MGLLDSMSKGDAFSTLIKFAGAKVVHDTMSGWATKPECVEAVGRSLYTEESPEAARRPWNSLTPKDKRVWLERARTAVLGLRDFLLKVNRPG